MLIFRLVSSFTFLKLKTKKSKYKAFRSAGGQTVDKNGSIGMDTKKQQGGVEKGVGLKCKQKQMRNHLVSKNGLSFGEKYP
jgi:hypothetical protein